MALFGSERMPLIMHFLQMRSRVLVPVVLGALLFSFVLSFAIAGTARAASNTCVFQVASTATFQATGGSASGVLPPLTAQITRYVDNCGHEQATMTVSGYSIGFTSFSAGVMVDPVHVWSSVNYPAPSVSTPVYTGNGVACGYIWYTVYQGSGQGSGCTPS